MTKRHNILLVTAVLLAACSAPDDTKPADAGPSADAGAGDVVTLEEGVYSSDDETDEAALAVWSDGEAAVGRLFAGDGLGFEVAFHEDHGALLTPVDGVCTSCSGGPWVVDIERIVRDTGFKYRLTVIDDAVGAGFDSLIMVPSDGFKPEFAPGPDYDVWLGDFFALAPDVSPAVLRSPCELSVNRETGAVGSFSCQDDDSVWSSEIADSWVGDDEQGSFETDAARFEGEIGGDPNLRVFSGEIFVGGEVVGAFEAVKLN